VRSGELALRCWSSVAMAGQDTFRA
jgi:hypothetical protein